MEWGPQPHNANPLHLNLVTMDISFEYLFKSVHLVFLYTVHTFRRFSRNKNGFVLLGIIKRIPPHSEEKNGYEKIKSQYSLQMHFTFFVFHLIIERMGHGQHINMEMYGWIAKNEIQTNCNPKYIPWIIHMVRLCSLLLWFCLSISFRLLHWHWGNHCPSASEVNLKNIYG